MTSWNKLVNKLIQRSNQVNLKALLNGAIFFKIFKKHDLNIIKLKRQPLFVVLKLYNQMYSSKQITKMQTLNYYSNFKRLVIK